MPSGHAIVGLESGDSCVSRAVGTPTGNDVTCACYVFDIGL